MSMVGTNSGSGSGGGGWKITDAAQQVGQDSTGRYTKGWQITFQLDGGQTGTVFVAGDSLNPAQVSSAVARQADALYGVLGLTDKSTLT